jgi:uncharacterized protein YlxW (UPF0749 family)
MPAPGPGPTATSRAGRPDGSMSLLVDITTNSLDAAYADRAARRSPGRDDGGGRPAASGPRAAGRRLVAVVLLVALGVLTGTAVAQVRQRAESSSGVRGELAEKVRERTAETDALVAEADRLRAQVDATRAAALGVGAAGQAAAESVAELALAAGTLPVVGPGIVVTVDDAPTDPDALPPARLRGGTPGPARVLDRDLQEVVNGIWAAGAEAVAVNGIRLTALTAIRSAGEAILVDFRPLSPPYEIEAIGDPADLQVGFLDGPSGRRFTTYTSLYGLRLDVQRADELRLPGAGEPELRAATPAPTTGGSP